MQVDTADNTDYIYMLKKCKLFTLFNTLYKGYFSLYTDITCIINHLNFFQSSFLHPEIQSQVRQFFILSVLNIVTFSIIPLSK